MALQQGQTLSFRIDIVQVDQDLSANTLKLALYDGFATLGPTTTTYSTTNEVVGTGYTAGGVALTGVTLNTSGSTVYVNFDNVVFNAAVTARCALIYNVTQGNKSIAVLDFGSDKTSSNFTITMPANTATAALIRSSN
jgi:hypothetical protein